MSDIHDFFIFVKKKVHDEPANNENPGVITDLERNQLCRYSRSYIRTDDNADRLFQIHQTGSNETDDHDCRSTAALQHRSSRCTGQYADKDIPCQ